MLGICRSDEPHYDMPATSEIKNELARRLYNLLDEFDDLKVSHIDEVLQAGYKYHRFGDKTVFEETSPYVE